MTAGAPAVGDRTRPMRVCYFGKAEVPLSLRGLDQLIRTAGVEVVSVTVGKTTDTAMADGALQQYARAHGIALLDYVAAEAALDEVDVVLSFSNSVVFPAQFLRRARLGVINMHPAVLPGYRGSHGLEHAILNGEPRVGVVLHYCVPDIDSGPIIDVETIPVEDEDTVRTLWPRIDDLAHRMLVELLPRLLAAARRGEMLHAQPQSEEHQRWFSTTSLPAQCRLDLSLPIELQRRLVRAYDHPHRRPAYIVSDGIRANLAVRHGDIVIASVEPAGGEND